MCLLSRYCRDVRRASRMASGVDLLWWWVNFSGSRLTGMGLFTMCSKYMIVNQQSLAHTSSIVHTRDGLWK